MVVINPFHEPVGRRQELPRGVSDGTIGESPELRRCAFSGESLHDRQGGERRWKQSARIAV